MTRLRRILATAKTVARDPRVPRWTRGLLAVGLLPIPGPFDEAVLLVALVLLLVRHRPIVRDAWREAGT